MDSLALEQRIAFLQNQLQSQSKPQNEETTEQVVSRIVEEKLTKLLGEPLQAVQQASQPIDYGSQLLVAVGSALSEEQQVWLSNDANRCDIPSFLTSPEGQAITRRFFSTYKQYKDKLCK
jgi:hypothetical protein